MWKTAFKKCLSRPNSFNFFNGFLNTLLKVNLVKLIWLATFVNIGLVNNDSFTFLKKNEITFLRMVTTPGKFVQNDPSFFMTFSITESRVLKYFDITEAL